MLIRPIGDACEPDHDLVMSLSPFGESASAVRGKTRINLGRGPDNRASVPSS
jgi:hypothetical protein